MARYGWVMIVALVCVTCAADEVGGGRNPSLPSPVTPPRIGEVNVTRVRAYIKDGRLQAFVQGELGDGCTTLESVTQRRTGNAVDITVTSKREGEVCTMILQFLNEWVPLDGAFSAGEYVVRANKAEVRFRLVVSETGELRIEPDPGKLPTPPYFPLG